MDISVNEELLNEAPFVFEGTVTETNAANLAIIEPTPSTAVVLVTEVLRAPETLSDQTGQYVTVQLLEPDSVKAGDSFVFFTDGWLYGENMAVIEVGRQEAGIPGMAGAIAMSNVMMAENAFRERLETADLVVLGTVMEMHMPDWAQAEAPGEHDPQWWSAEITIEEVLKGGHQKPTVTFMYPSSIDITWYEAPKPQPGQYGIWILHRGEEPSLPKTAYTALNPLDYQAPDRLEDVKRLIG